MDGFEVGGKTYRTVTKISAMNQLHIVRKLGPVLVGFKDFANGATDIKDLPKLLEQLGPVLQAVSLLSDADTEYVVKTCMDTVSVLLPDGRTWQRVWNSSAKSFMFDIPLVDMMQIVGKVLMGNMGSFLSKGEPTSTEAAA